MRSTDLERVRGLPVFAETCEETFRTVTELSYLQRFPAGAVLLYEGDPVDFLYVLLSGQVELQGSWNDKETTLAILRPISTFILAAVVLETDALMSARTLERSEILMIHGDAFRRAMADDAKFGVSVARELAACYRGLVRTIKNQKLRGSVERLANYLLAVHAKTGDGDRVRLPHEKRVLASLLGMTPENLSRAFNALQAHGVVVSGADVRLTKMHELQRLAKPDPLIDNYAAAGEAEAEKPLLLKTQGARPG